MKTQTLLTALYLGSVAILPGQDLQPVAGNSEEKLAQLSEQITKGAEELAYVQDELVGDVMELIEDQTVPQVIALLEEVEKIMVEVTDNLIEAKTDGATIAAETEVIEKIFEAAKKKQQSGDGESQESMGAMLDMMQRMMGVEPGDQKPGQEGEKPGEQAGEGSTGDSDAKNGANKGNSEGSGEERTIPKGSGLSGRDLPLEFRQLLDAYNKNSQ